MTDKKTIPPAPTWDIESVFPGGADSTEFKAFREKVRSEIDQLTKNVGEVPAAIDASTLDQWVDFVQKVQSTLENIELVVAFAGCLTSQNVDDAKGHTIRAEGDVLYSDWKKVLTLLEAMSLKQSVAQWQMLLDDKRLDEIKFYLKELRDIAASKMAPELETLALDLSVNGFHAWNRRRYDAQRGGRIPARPVSQS
jgi:oligoendopeptidase F